MVEITEAEQNKQKRIKKNQDSLRNLWNNVKHPNIQIICVPEDRKKGHEETFEEIIDDKFPKVGKKIATQVQEAQRVPYKINPRRNMPRHILIKLTKTQRTNIKSNMGKAADNIQGDPHKGKS